MDIFEAIETRRSVRKYKPDVPPLEDLNILINSARLAPSPNNSQMWHFLGIYSPEIRARLKQAIIENYDRIKGYPEAKDSQERIEYYKEFSTFFTEAPLCIAVLMEPQSSLIIEILKDRGLSPEEIERSRPHPDIMGVGAAVQNLMLAATSLGYGSCWLTAPIYAHEGLEEILNVKSPYRLVSFVSIGKPDDNAPLERNKKELGEILTVIR